MLNAPEQKMMTAAPAEDPGAALPPPAGAPRGGGRLQMRSQPAGKREARPGVAGSANSGRPARLMGGKALSNRKKNIPPPFNNEMVEALVQMSVHLLRDPAFCNAKVRALSSARCAARHTARPRRQAGVPSCICSRTLFLLLCLRARPRALWASLCHTHTHTHTHTHRHTHYI